MYETTMTMVGRLATAVTRRDFKDGGVKATFRLASTERRFDRGSQQWVDGSRLFLTVVCWRALAEHVIATLTVGDPVIVQGKLREREYEKDGRVHSVIEIDAATVGPDLARCSAAVARRNAQLAAVAPRPDGEAGPSPDDTGPARPADVAPGEPGEWDARPLVPEYVDADGATASAAPRRDEAAVQV